MTGPDLSPCAIFDIDGTIANCEDRRGFIDGDEKDWDAFFEERHIMQDTPIYTMIGVANALYNNGLAIAFVTGRPERTRMATVKWISIHLPWLTEYSLLMRRDDNLHVHSAEVKRQCLKWLKKGFAPVIAFEDRKADAVMWRHCGLLCCHIAEGNF